MKTKIQLTQRNIPESLVDKVGLFLGSKGLRWFRLINQFHGEVSPVLKLHQSRKFIPVHSVHFSEGMQIRNFMRSLDECSEWTCHELDDNWARVVDRLIERHKSQLAEAG